MFRPEARVAQSNPFLGAIRLATVPSASITAVLSFGLAALLVSFALWGQSTRKVQVAGVLLPPGDVDT